MVALRDMRYASRRVMQRPTVDHRGARAVVALSLLCAVSLSVGCATAPRGRPSVPESQPPLAAAIAPRVADPVPAGEAPAGEDEAPPTAASPAQASSETAPASTDTASTTRAPSTTTSTPAIVEAPSPSCARGCKVLIIGDSKIATDLGAALQSELARRPELVVARRGKSATGLSRPDFFDWWAEAERLLAQHAPDVVIVGLGGNDGQELAPRAGARGRVAWRSAAWPEAYGARVRSLIERLTGDERRVIWLEVTTADRAHLEGKLVLIREAQRQAVEAFGPRASYLRTEHHLRTDDGGVLRQVTLAGDRRAQPLRIEDGIHFSVYGSRWLAPRLAAELLPLIGVPTAE